jgi:hypothetical protein
MIIITDLQAAARTLGLQLVVVNASTYRDLEPAFASFSQQHVGAVLVGNGAYINRRPEQLAALAARHALPATYQSREFALAGGLMSYGSSLLYFNHQLGIYAGRILKGEKPRPLHGQGFTQSNAFHDWPGQPLHVRLNFLQDVGRGNGHAFQHRHVLLQLLDPRPYGCEGQAVLDDRDDLLEHGCGRQSREPSLAGIDDGRLDWPLALERLLLRQQPVTFNTQLFQIVAFPKYATIQPVADPLERTVQLGNTAERLGAVAEEIEIISTMLKECGLAAQAKALQSVAEPIQKIIKQLRSKKDLKTLLEKEKIRMTGTALMIAYLRKPEAKTFKIKRA